MPYGKPLAGADRRAGAGARNPDLRPASSFLAILHRTDPYQRYLCTNWRPTSAAATMCARRCSSRQVHVPPRRAGGLRPVGEVEFVQGLAAAGATGLYGPCRAAAAIVGHADLKLGDRVEPVLQALQAASPNRFRGIRHTVTWDPHPEIESREKEGVLASAEYRAGAQRLRGWAFRLTSGSASAVARAGRLCQGSARFDDHPQPSRRPYPDRAVCRPRR